MQSFAVPSPAGEMTVWEQDSAAGRRVRRVAQVLLYVSRHQKQPSSPASHRRAEPFDPSHGALGHPQAHAGSTDETASLTAPVPGRARRPRARTEAEGVVIERNLTPRLTLHRQCSHTSRGTMRRFGIATVIAALLLPAGAHRAQARAAPDRRAADRDRHPARRRPRGLRERPPGHLLQSGPACSGSGRELETYFFAHEYGHIRYGHTGAALAAGEGDLGALRVRQELEADCYAARTLGESDPRPSDAAHPVLHPHGPVPLRRLAPERRPARGQDSRRAFPRPTLRRDIVGFQQPGRTIPSAARARRRRRSTPRPTNPSLHGRRRRTAAKTPSPRIVHCQTVTREPRGSVLTSPSGER